MPKRIPDLDSRILSLSRQTLLEQGYNALSMRTLAAQCGVAVGTLYNYYPSKAALVARLILDDWQQMLLRMAEAAESKTTLSDGLGQLCRILEGFTGRYRSVWAQYGGGRAVGYTAKYHITLRQQLAQPLERVLEVNCRTDLLPLSGVLAETMLSCALNPDLGSHQFALLASTWMR